MRRVVVVQAAARLQPDGGRVDAQGHVREQGEEVDVREGLLRVDVGEGEADGAAAIHAPLHHHRGELRRVGNRGRPQLVVESAHPAVSREHVPRVSGVRSKGRKRYVPAAASKSNQIYFDCNQIYFDCSCREPHVEGLRRTRSARATPIRP